MENVLSFSTSGIFCIKNGENYGLFLAPRHYDLEKIMPIIEKYLEATQEKKSEFIDENGAPKTLKFKSIKSFFDIDIDKENTILELYKKQKNDKKEYFIQVFKQKRKYIAIKPLFVENSIEKVNRNGMTYIIEKVFLKKTNLESFNITATLGTSRNTKLETNEVIFENFIKSFYDNQKSDIKEALNISKTHDYIHNTCDCNGTSYDCMYIDTSSRMMIKHVYGTIDLTNTPNPEIVVHDSNVKKIISTSNNKSIRFLNCEIDKKCIQEIFGSDTCFNLAHFSICGNLEIKDIKCEKDIYLIFEDCNNLSMKNSEISIDGMISFSNCKNVTINNATLVFPNNISNSLLALMSIDKTKFSPNSKIDLVNLAALYIRQESDVPQTIYIKPRLGQTTLEDALIDFEAEDKTTTNIILDLSDYSKELEKINKKIAKQKTIFSKYPYINVEYIY